MTEQKMTDAELTAAYEEASLDAHHAEQMASETEGQFGSEAAGYGDAWAGAAADVMARNAAASSLNAALDALHAEMVARGLTEPEEDFWPHDDQPGEFYD